MSDLLRTAPQSWCKKLRWKSYPIDQEHVSVVQELFVRGGQTFLCHATANAFGADDGPVAPERCARGRACYVEHPTLVMLKRSLV